MQIARLFDDNTVGFDQIKGYFGIFPMCTSFMDILLAQKQLSFVVVVELGS